MPFWGSPQNHPTTTHGSCALRNAIVSARDFAESYSVLLGFSSGCPNFGARTKSFDVSFAGGGCFSGRQQV